MRIVYGFFRRRGALLWALLLAALLSACGGGAAVQPPTTPQPIRLTELRLELCAPHGGAEFPAAARDFGDAFRSALAAEGITAESLRVSFSRADAATAQAVAEGGVTLAVAEPLAALRAGLLPLTLLAQTGNAAEGAIVATDSAYGAQLAARAATGKALSWTEWSRATVGAVTADSTLYAAADYALAESAGYGLSRLAAWRTFDSEAALLAAAERGEVDALLLRRDAAAGRSVLLETGSLYEAALVVAGETELPLAAVTAAFQAAADTPEGRALLAQYACGTVTAAEEETIGALRRLAEWEDNQ